MKDQYTAPTLTHLGKVEELTKQQFNKIGANSDSLTPLQPQVVGSFTPFP